MSTFTLIAIVGALLIAASQAAVPAELNEDQSIRITLHSQLDDGITRAKQECCMKDEEADSSGLAFEKLAAHSYKLMKSPPFGGKSASQQKRGCHMDVRAAPSLPFMGTMQVGTPPQIFNALFDTGSPVSWMLHSKCQVNEAPWAPPEEGPERAKFAHDKSSSYKRAKRERVSLKYAQDINLHGWWVNETVRLADGSTDLRSFAVRDQPLAMITHLQGPEKRLDDENFPSAVIGLGFPSQTSGDHNTLFESLMLKEHVRDPVFSFYFKAPREAGGEQKGELILGEIDKLLYSGHITWTAVTETPAWQVRVHSIRAGEATVCAHGCEAILSTGTNIIVGPNEQVAQLNEQLGFARTRADRRMFAAPGLCADHPKRNMSLVFKIEDNNFEVKADKLMTDLETCNGQKRCVSALRVLNLEPGAPDGKWVLGAPFISSFYTIFNYGELKVGFAEPSRPRSLRS